MGQIDKVGDLEIDQDLAFQRREWVAERVGWLLLALFLGAAVAGLFAGGPIGNAHASDGSGLARLAYERFARYKAPLQMELQVSGEAGREGQVRVRVSRSYLQAVQVEAITPQPESVSSDGEYVEYSFRTSDRSGDVTVSFDVQPEELGMVRGEIGLGDSQPISFSQFVYP